MFSVKREAGGVLPGRERQFVRSGVSGSYRWLFFLPGQAVPRSILRSKKDGNNMKWKNMEPWQKKRLIITLVLVIGVALTYLGYTCNMLIQDKQSESEYWSSALTPTQSAQEHLDRIDANAVPVTVGTWLETFKEVGLKSSTYRMEFMLWFRWDGDKELDMANNFRIYKGVINKSQLVKESHENGVNYQLLRVDATIVKNYWTIRFPLESHQLRMYVESNYTADQVVFVDDTENSGISSALDVPGYDIARSATGIYTMEYENTQGDPALPNAMVKSEHVTALEINRQSWGLYLKCFIALFGTSLWVLVTLFINTYHRIDPLSMIPAALFGTVSNIMVGANLLPDVLQLGLLEFVNIWGVMTILMVAMVIININRIRSKFEDKDFAALYGKVMFYTILTLVIIGHIALPLSALMVA